MEIYLRITVIIVMKTNNGSSLKTINGRKLLSIHVNKSRKGHHVNMINPTNGYLLKNNSNGCIKFNNGSPLKTINVEKLFSIYVTYQE